MLCQTGKRCCVDVEEREEEKKKGEKGKCSGLKGRRESESVGLERWVQLVMGFISLGLLCFTVQTVTVKVRLQLNGQCCGSPPFFRETKTFCYQHLLSVLII